MTPDFVICDRDIVDASLVPPSWLGTPGGCPRGLYDTLRVTNGLIAYWDQHWDRLVGSVRENGGGVDLGVVWIGLKGRVEGLCARQGGAGIGRLRLMVFDKPERLLNGVEVRCVAFVRMDAGAQVGAGDGGFGCYVSEVTRVSGDVDFTRKALGRAVADSELARAKGLGYDDVIFCNDRGEICEAAYANVGVVIGGAIVTPLVSSPCLPGLMMARVEELARQVGVAFSYEVFELGDLARADEVFLTSSVRGIQQVTVVEEVFNWRGLGEGLDNDGGVVEMLKGRLSE